MYTLDGLPLNDPTGRWYLHDTTGLRILPARMASGASIPGMDGVMPSLRSTFEPGALSVVISVRRPTHDQMMGGLELLFGVLGQRHRLLPLRHDYGNGQIREAMVEVLSDVTPDRLTQELSRLPVMFRVPSAFWRDTATVDAGAGINLTSATTTLAQLAGSTGPIPDALIQVRGAFTQATLTDPVSGDSITISGGGTGTEYVVIDTANWTARKQTSNTWSTTGGTNWINNVVSNRGSGPMMSLNPDFSTGAGRVQLTTIGTGTASAQATVRAKRSFL
jgi:hypothetical protein